MNIETSSENVRTLDESVEAAAITDQQNKYCVEAEVIIENH